MLVKSINRSTGEVIELEVKDLATLMHAYNVAKDYEKMATNLKDQLKDELEKYLDDTGKSEELNGQQFKRIAVQRMTYDKATLRNIVDDDTFDVLTKVDKGATDKYLKENLESLGSASTELRNAMVPDGNPYSMVKLEKLTRG